MFLSRVSLHDNLQPAQYADYYAKFKDQDRDLYFDHQILWTLFHEDDSRQFIFRSEIANNAQIYYILSSSRPTQEHELFNIYSKEFLPRLYQGQKLAFKLRANPTFDDAKTAKRHDVLMHAKFKCRDQDMSKQELDNLLEQAAIGWLKKEKRMENWGLEINSAVISNYRQQKFSKKRSVVKFSTVDYEGVLTVKDPAKFWGKYIKGYGHSKAFGCGLMLIKAIDSMS